MVVVPVLVVLTVSIPAFFVGPLGIVACRGQQVCVTVTFEAVGRVPRDGCGVLSDLVLLNCERQPENGTRFRECAVCYNRQGDGG